MSFSWLRLLRFYIRARNWIQLAHLAVIRADPRPLIGHFGEAISRSVLSLGACASGVPAILHGLIAGFNCFLAQKLFGARLFVLVSLLCTAGMLIPAYHCHYLWLALPSVAGFYFGYFSKKKFMAAVCSLAPFLFCLYFLWRLPQPATNDLSQWIPKGEVVFRGRVEAVPDQSEQAGGNHIVVAPLQLLFPRHQMLGGLTAVTVYGGGVMHEGDVLQIRGRLVAPKEKTYPWQSDYADYLRRAGIFSTCIAQSARGVHSPDPALATRGVRSPDPALATRGVRSPDPALAMRGVHSLDPALATRGIHSPVHAPSIQGVNSLEPAQSMPGVHPAHTLESAGNRQHSKIDSSPETTHAFYCDISDWGKQLLTIVDRIRLVMIGSHRKFMGQKNGDLLSSMVLGDRAVNLDASVTQEFRDVGLSHILAASGFNVSLVIAMTLWSGRAIVRNKWLLNLLCFVAMVVYVLLAGASPSVMRAAIMITMVLIARCLYRSLHLPAALSAALLLTVLVDPCSITDAGLQLSYAATAGIVAGSAPLAECLTQRCKLPKWLAEALSVVLLAQCSVLPIQLMYFWQIGLFFLPANLLVTPLVPPITVCGFVSSLLVTIHFQVLQSMAWWLDLISTWAVNLMMLMINYFASWDAAKLRLGPPAVIFLLLNYGAFGGFLFALRMKCGRSLACTVLLLSTAGLFWREPLPEFMIACFRHSVVCIDSDHRSITIGDATGEAHKFATYFGARDSGHGNGNFNIVKRQGIQFLFCKRSNMVIGLIEDSNVAVINKDVPRCDVLVLETGSPVAGQANPPGSRMVPEIDPDKVAQLIRRTRPEVLLVDQNESRQRRRRLDGIVEQFPDLEIDFEQAGSAFMVADKSQPGSRLRRWSG